MAVATTTVEIRPATHRFLGRSHGLFIGGVEVEARGGRHEVYGPADGAVIATVARAGAEDVDKAVRSAHAAFESGVWTNLLPAERERILLRFADLVETHAEDLAQLETLNQGKSINISRHVDAGGAPAWIRYVAGLSTKIVGRTFDVSIGAVPGVKYNASTRREPVGVVAAITPWNFPMLIALWKIMPALASGCTVVLKPSEVTPLTTLRLAALALEAGVPPGAFNVVTGDGAAGRALVEHPLISKVSFTGSTATGKAIARTCAERMTRATLELGGKNPAVFLKDAPIDQAVGGALLGGFFNNGQVCAASSRLYVAREIYSDFVDALSAAVEGMSIGPGLDPTAQINPVASALQRDRILGFVRRAQEDGARLAAGGEGLDRPGYYVRPTVVVDASPHSEICREEVFGPVVTVTPFDGEEEGLALANDTRLGLTASLWTNDLRKAMAYVPRLKAGTVWVNTHNLIDPNMPFGGYGESGIGRDFGIGALDGYLETKSVCIAY